MAEAQKLIVGAFVTSTTGVTIQHFALAGELKTGIGPTVEGEVWVEE